MVVPYTVFAIGNITVLYVS